MNVILKDIPVVMPIETALSEPWLLNDQILQSTIRRFSQNINFLLALPERFSYRCLGQQISREIPSVRDRTYVGAENLWARLFQIVEVTSKQHLMVVPENACGMPLAGIDLLWRMVHDPNVDFVYSDQIIGLLPLVISKRFLLHMVASESQPVSTAKPLRLLQRSMFFPQSAQILLRRRHRSKRTDDHDNRHLLPDIRKFPDAATQNLRFFREEVSAGPLYYLPRLSQDRALAHYLLQHCDALEQILQKIDSLPLPEESDLFLHFREFRDSFAITYPRHVLEGQPEIPEPIRGLTSNPKSVGECYLRAINMTKFLKTYAGMRHTSRVLDIGCGWGVLALGLVNLIEDPGSYLGLDIQKQAIEWGLQNIAPLNSRFSFMHLDVANSRYNPNGSISHDEVHLPLDADSIDLVLLSSVFTHMRREGIEHYLKEIRRVLRPGGIAAFSYFHSSFFGENEDYRVRYPDDPDRMTIFSTAEMRRLLQVSGLSEARPQVNYDTRFSPSKPFFQTFMFGQK